MSDSQYLSYDPSLTDRHRYMDERYDGQMLRYCIPSLRQSVHHTRERAGHTTAPRSYINPNAVLPPLSFRLATESHRVSAISVNRGQDGDLVHPIFPIYNIPSDNPSNMARNVLDPDSQPTYPISRFPLFRLSEEAVGRILRHLSYTDLVALALVDKDCCQLARTRLFRAVWLNFSNTSMALLTTLVNEGRQRFGSRAAANNRWWLGACIRRITICRDSDLTRPRNWARRPWIEDRVSDIEGMELHSRHMNALELVLRTALPNLEFLDWRDRTTFPKLMASSIGHPPITRLELHCLQLREDFALDAGDWNQTWRLRSLLLCVSIVGEAHLNADAFIASILKLSAATLEELVWKGSGEYTFGTSPLLLPQLTKLQLSSIKANDNVWSSLILADGESRLTHLSMDGCAPGLGSFLAHLGRIATLSHLSWTNTSCISNLDSTIFLLANPQLESCRFEEPRDRTPNANTSTDRPREGEQYIVPIFSQSSFPILTSLSLVYATPTIPTAALRAIAKISALQHLCLSAGSQFGRQINWRVDHKALRKCLRPLKQLKWLVLTRDGYAHANEPLSGFRKWQPGMEIQHRDDMMRYARLFALMLPALEWAYFGMVPMAVDRGVGQELMIVPLQGRADSVTLLGEMWGDRRPKGSIR